MYIHAEAEREERHYHNPAAEARGGAEETRKERAEKDERGEFKYIHLTGFQYIVRFENNLFSCQYLHHNRPEHLRIQTHPQKNKEF